MMEGIAGILERRRREVAMTHYQPGTPTPTTTTDLPRILGGRSVGPALDHPLALPDNDLVEKVNGLQEENQAKQRIIQAFHTQVISATVALGGMPHDDMLALIANKIEKMKEVEKEAQVLYNGFQEFSRAVASPDQDGIRPIDCLTALLRKCDDLQSEGGGPREDNEEFFMLVEHVKGMNNRLRTLINKLNNSTTNILT
jgi:hypothetical protein